MQASTRTERMKAERRKHYRASFRGRGPRAGWQWARDTRQSRSSFTGTSQSPAPASTDLHQRHSEDPALTSQPMNFWRMSSHGRGPGPAGAESPTGPGAAQARLCTHLADESTCCIPDPGGSRLCKETPPRIKLYDLTITASPPSPEIWELERSPTETWEKTQGGSFTCCSIT